jgi:hypothetical protein
MRLSNRGLDLLRKQGSVDKAVERRTLKNCDKLPDRGILDAAAKPDLRRCKRPLRRAKPAPQPRAAKSTTGAPSPAPRQVQRLPKRPLSRQKIRSVASAAPQIPPF